MSLGTRGSFIMFLFPTLNVIRGSLSFLIQWLALSRLSHMHKKHGCFVYADCCPSRKLIILRSTQFSSYAGCILCTQEPVLLVRTSLSALSNDLLELKRIHLSCVTTHISNSSWNCQCIGAKSSPHNSISKSSTSLQTTISSYFLKYERKLPSLFL